MGKSDFLINETDQHYVIKKPSFRYLDEFVRLKCAPDLLALKLFPNAKEITESMALFNAVKKELPDISELGRKMNVAVIGDGSTPRTAALFAFMSSWQVTSIDPRLKPLKGIIKRLCCILAKVEDVIDDVCPEILVFPHAHTKFDELPSWCGREAKIIVSMPCCEPWASGQLLWRGIPPYKVYADWGVHSPHRTIRVWKS